MKVKLKTLVDAEAALAEVGRLGGDNTKVHGKAKFRLIKLISGARNQLVALGEARKEMIERLKLTPMLDEDGKETGHFNTTPEYLAEEKELLAEEVEIPDFEELELPADFPLSIMASAILMSLNVTTLEEDAPPVPAKSNPFKR